MTYLLLFWEFFQIGLFAVGGGMATIPFLFDLSARHPEWYSPEMLSDMIAISESTPGPIGINMASYVGNTVSGVLGGVVATLSLVLPSYITIIIIAKVLERFKESPLVTDLFRFIRPVALGMMAYAFWVVFEVSVISEGVILPVNAIAFVIFFALIYLLNKKVHPLAWIGLGALFGIFLL